MKYLIAIPTLILFGITGFLGISLLTVVIPFFITAFFMEKWGMFYGVLAGLGLYSTLIILLPFLNKIDEKYDLDEILAYAIIEIGVGGILYLLTYGAYLEFFQ